MNGTLDGIGRGCIPDTLGINSGFGSGVNLGSGDGAFKAAMDFNAAARKDSSSNSSSAMLRSVLRCCGNIQCGMTLNWDR